MSQAATYILCASIILATGCNSGETLVEAKGQLLQNGQPWQAGNESLTVVFYPDTGGKPTNTYPATLNDDGSFTVQGRDLEGIPPGKYRVGIQVMAFPNKRPAQVPAQSQGPSSEIVREVTVEKPTVDPIDIVKPTG